MIYEVILFDERISRREIEEFNNRQLAEKYAREATEQKAFTATVYAEGKPVYKTYRGNGRKLDGKS
jgi:hypothetical protein